MQELAALRPVALICEGTRAEPDGEEAPNYTEEDVEERSLREIRQASGLVIADFGPRNVERLHTFARIGRETGRGLVILPKDAYLLKAAHLADPEIPSVDDLSDLLIYDEPKVRRDRWDNEIRQTYEGRLVSPMRIRDHQNQYILCFSFYDLTISPVSTPEKAASTSIHPTRPSTRSFRWTSSAFATG